MGRGGTPPLSATWNKGDRQGQTKNRERHTRNGARIAQLTERTDKPPNISGVCRYGKSRAISSARLWCRHLYTCALSTSSSATTLSGDLILGRASHLDAFSAYPIPTWIPGNAPGGTTGKPEVGPTRSSRTSVKAPQISCAHDR